ncbi:MAG: UDP-N-acetylmuramate dehydrogenase [Thermoanaerobaculum sp.]
MELPPWVAGDVPLAPYTTLELGGPAEFLAQVPTPEALAETCRWAQEHRLPVAVLAGGSNVVVADEGVPGVVLKVAWEGLEVHKEPGAVTVVAAAGTPLDQLVALAVAEGWAGLEGLSGIPGTVGATPIQNVGAYGQEVGDRLVWVEVFDLERQAFVRVSREACGLSYRKSRFRGQRRYVITRVALALTPGGTPTLAYPELAARFAGKATPSLADVREAVLELRRAKGMVWRPGEPESRTVGSFFKNPILHPQAWDELCRRAWEQDLLPAGQHPPHFSTPQGVKLSAAWLVERAGFSKGFRQGAFGVSPRHALALVHWGGGTARELVALAHNIQERVRRQFGVVLEPEPVFLGFGASPPLPRGVAL